MDVRTANPEFYERFDHFAFDEVPNEEAAQLEPKTRYIAILAALMGCGGEEAFSEMLPAALDAGVTPVEISETVYQGADYLG